MAGMSDYKYFGMVQRPDEQSPHQAQLPYAYGIEDLAVRDREALIDRQQTGGRGVLSPQANQLYGDHPRGDLNLNFNRGVNSVPSRDSSPEGNWKLNTL